MVKISRFRYLQWRNPFTDVPAAVVTIDSGASGAWRIDALGPDNIAVLRDRLPGLFTGAVEATVSGVLAVLCLSLQKEHYEVLGSAGAVGDQFWFASVDRYYAQASVGEAAAFLTELIARPQISRANLDRGFEILSERCRKAALDTTTAAMVAAATRRGIPWFRIDRSIADVQFGHGHKQHRVLQTNTGKQSRLGSNYANNKAATCALLSGAGLPVGQFGTADNPEQAAALATSIGFPVVLKPIFGRQGKGVVIGLTNADAVRSVARNLLQSFGRILIQSFIPGNDYRLLVVAGRLVAAARRDPAAIIGDGQKSVRRLIEGANRDPRRGRGHRSLLTMIEVDEEVRALLSEQGFNLSSVPPLGVSVRLRRTANISTGGTAVDVTEKIHPDNAWLAERAATVIGLEVSGIDLITPDISRSWREVGGGICEINAMVALRPHWLGDRKRDVVGPILDTIYPSGEDGRVPTALVTGSNGKTTTTRMLDHILRAAGHVVGSATTDGVTVNGRAVVNGDLAGTSGLSIILRDPTVTAACLETARGGVLRRGIGVERCEVAALLNVDHEQVGIDGINTLEEMAQLKRKVVETARNAFVFNAEDSRCFDVSRGFPVERIILFALDPSSQTVRDHLAKGGTAVVPALLDGCEKIVVRKGDSEIVVVETAAIPATFGGKVRHNVACALAATALAHGMNVSPNWIAAGLHSFFPSLQHSQGRFNFIEDLPVPAFFDYANNPAAISRTMKALENLALQHQRRICLITSPGNRPDAQIGDCSHAVAGRSDYYVGFERVEWRRGRAPGEIALRLTDALVAAGVPSDRVATTPTQKEAMVAAANTAEAEDLVIVLGTDIRTSLPDLRAAFAEKAEGLPNIPSTIPRSPSR